MLTCLSLHKISTLVISHWASVIWMARVKHISIWSLLPWRLKIAIPLMNKAKEQNLPNLFKVQSSYHYRALFSLPLGGAIISSGTYPEVTAL